MRTTQVRRLLVTAVALLTASAAAAGPPTRQDSAGHTLYAQSQVLPRITDDLAARCSTDLGRITYPQAGLAVLHTSPPGWQVRHGPGSSSPLVPEPGHVRSRPRPSRREPQPFFPRVSGIAGEAVRRDGGREDEPAGARLHVLPRLRHLGRLAAQSGAQRPVHRGGDLAQTSPAAVPSSGTRSWGWCSTTAAPFPFTVSSAASAVTMRSASSRAPRSFDIGQISKFVPGCAFGGRPPGASIAR